MNKGEQKTGTRLFLGALTLFLVTFAIQTAHEIEHLAQVYQRLWLGLGPQQAHGVLFFLDIEWNHFLFNLSYFALLVVLLLMFFVPSSLRNLLRRQRFWKIGVWFFLIGVISQGYHLFEHVVRMGQFFQLGCTPCPGILGQFLDLTYTHFILNTATWLAPLALLPAFYSAFVEIRLYGEDAGD